MDKNYILNYMPDYYDGVYEMEELLKAQGLALSNFDSEEEKALLNQFIIKADEKGISIFENEAGIRLNPNDSLEARRNRVLLHLLPPKPLTVRYLNYLLSVMNLKANVSVDYKNRKALVDGKSADINSDEISSIKYLMNICLPANMVYLIRIALSQSESRKQLYYGMTTLHESEVIILANKNQVSFINQVKTKLHWGIGLNEIHEATIPANKDQWKN